MYHETVVVSVDVGGRVGLELDGDVGHGGVELVAGQCSTVLAQDVGRQIVSVVEGQHVVFTKMEAV